MNKKYLRYLPEITLLPFAVGFCIMVNNIVKHPEQYIREESKKEQIQERLFDSTKILEKQNFPVEGYDSRLYVSNDQDELSITQHGKLDSICQHRTYVDAHFNKDNSLQYISYWGSYFVPMVKTLSDSNIVRKVYGELLSEKQVDSVYTKIR